LPDAFPHHIITRVARRIHVSSHCPGEIVLDDSQAHHLRDVLRLKIGSNVELFDDAGLVGQATVTRADASGVSVRVDSIHGTSTESSTQLIVASAVPKGDRADWMIEKLSELGVSRFIPLQTERSVVHPTGSGKRERWMRIATESAKQSRRSGVMRIDELTRINDLISNLKSGTAWYLSTADDARPIADLLNESTNTLSLLIGPEGGWSDDEIARFDKQNLTPVKLTATILRVETAAIAAAAIASIAMNR
jgi:16S rRNA (uracil1498-N3)-methyltransferase